MGNKRYFTVTDCDFKFECSKKWDDLIITEDPNVRHCQQCNQSVTLCKSQDEFEKLTSKGKCIAIDIFPMDKGHDNRYEDLKIPRRLGLVDLKDKYSHRKKGTDQ